MFRGIRIAQLLAVFLTGAGIWLDGQLVAAQPSVGNATASCRWDEVLRWLPENTETICVVQKPYTITPSEEQKTVSIEAGFTSFPAQSSHHSKLAGQKVALMVEGSRCFRAPKALGMMPYQGCQVTIFQGDWSPGWTRLVESVKAGPYTNMRIAETEVIVFREKREGDWWTFYLARPRTDILLSATDQDYLTALLNRIGKQPTRRALPEDLPEWKHVDTSAPIWAVRHFDRERGRLDSSSPFFGFPPSDYRSDRQATGVVFHYRPEKDESVRVRYLSGARDALDLATRRWNMPSEGLIAEARSADAGVIEIRASLKNEEAVGTFLMVLFGILGHAIWV